jgi:Fe2+ or Zn2+ uptake regulation protein
VQQAEAHWKIHGGRLTHVRRLICEAVERVSGDFSAIWLWEEIRRKDPGVSLASVYRTMAGLQAAGLVKELPSRGEQRVFVRAGTEEPAVHAGVVCANCGMALPLDGGGLNARRQEQQARELGFAPESIALQIQGRCPKCLLS